MATKTKSLTIEEMQQQVADARAAALDDYRRLLADPASNETELRELARMLGRETSIDADREAINRAEELQAKVRSNIGLNNKREALYKQVEALDDEWNRPKREYEAKRDALMQQIRKNERESEALDEALPALKQLRADRHDLFDEPAPPPPPAPTHSAMSIGTRAVNAYGDPIQPAPPAPPPGPFEGGKLRPGVGAERPAGMASVGH
jgi:hypothetical protein